MRATVDEDGDLISYDDYYPFGLQMPQRSLVGDNKTREKFTGHELDEESGLLYVGARYYMPEIGRWLSADPVDQYASPYTYVGNNPLGLVDPTGTTGVNAENRNLLDLTSSQKTNPI